MEEITLYPQSVSSTNNLKNLWNDDSIRILLTEYKRVKEALWVKKSSNMTKKGWDIIKKKLHAAGYKDIRLQHVVKKFSTLKLHYKEYKEGLPVKQRIYNFIGLLSDILDDDPYIAFAKPTKRMKEKKLYEKRFLRKSRGEHSGTDFPVKFEMELAEGDSIDEHFIDTSLLLEQVGEDGDRQEITDRGYLRGRLAKNKRKLPPETFEKPNLPSWICYLVDLLKKEEQQKSEQLWKLHDQIMQAERVKTDMLEKLITTFGSVSTELVSQPEPAAPAPSVTYSNDPPRNIIIVDEEGSIYLRPTEAVKRKGETIKYGIPHKIFKPIQALDESNYQSFVTEDPNEEIQLQFLGDGDEIIIENCEEPEIYEVEQVYEEPEEMNVISHVEIVEESENEVSAETHLDAIEFMQPIKDK